MGGSAPTGCRSTIPSTRPEHYPSPPDAWSSAGFTDAHDFDDGWGQDAWLLFRPASTGSHWIEVDSQGGFAGSYVIAITDAEQYNEREYENGSSAACLTSRVVEPEHDPRLVFSTNVLSVAEGATARYTLRLATEPTAPVSVTVSSGDTGALAVPSMSLAFTTSNWHEEQSVTVRGVHDNDTSAESVTVSHTASGGDYKSITGSVTVRVIDDDAPALVLSADELRVDEGDTETYSLRLATRPTGPVTVEVRSGDSGAVGVPVSFVFTTGNWNQPRPVIVRGIEDEDTSDETVTVSHEASGGGYGGTAASLEVHVVDDDAAALAFSRSSVDVDEGDTATYTMWLETQPSGPVTVEVRSGDTSAVSVSAGVVFTTSNWSQPRTVTVRGVEDDDFSDESVAVSHEAFGGGYSGVTGSVTVNVADDDVEPPRLMFSRSSVDVGEGATATYTLRLRTRPSGPVTVEVSSADSGAVAVPVSFVFTTGNWSQARTVTVRGVEDDDFSDESVAVSHEASGGGYDGVSGSVTVNVADDDVEPLGLVFSRSSVDVDEGDTATYTLRLETRPSGSVTVAVSSGDAGAVAVPVSLVFTTGNWDQARTVTVRGVEDDDFSDESVAVSHEASGGGYDGVSGSVTVNVADDDVEPPGLVFSPQQLSVGEGDTATYTLRLATRPTGAVTVAVSSGDTGAVAVPASFVFTASNWDRARTVTVRGVDDDDTSDETVAVAHSASGGGYGSVTGTVTVTVDDDDTVPPGLVFSPRQVDVDEGDTATYTLRLATRPTGAVTVAVSSGDTGAVAVPASFVFTASNWDRARTVTVRGVDDDDISDESVAVSHSASGGGYGSVTGTVTVNVADDDVVPPGLVFSARQVDVGEGDTATYTLRLATRPTGAVTVAVSSGDTGAVAVPASFVFTASNWDRARTVTVRGVDDDDLSDETVAVSHSASGGGYGSVTGSVTVTVDDDDTVPPGLVFSARQVDVGEGATATYTLRLATRPTAAVTVAVSSGDTGAVAVPASFVFTTGNWDQVRTVTVRGVDDDDTSDESVAVSHTASGGGYGSVTGSVTVTVDDDDTVPPGLVFSARQVDVGEGDTATYTLRLATRPTGAVTVAVRSGDAGAVSVPASFVFTTGNWDQVRTVTVRGVSDDDTSDESVAVAHTASGGGYGSVTGTVTVTVDDDDVVPPGLVFSARQVDVGEGDTATYTLRLATRPTGAVTVAVRSGDSGAVSVPVSFVFTTGNWDQVRTVTVRGVEDGDTSDESVAVAHTASGGGYGGVSGTVTVTVDDDDTVPPALVLLPRRVSVGEGDSATYRLSLATRPTAAVTVTLSSGDTGAVSVPASFVFTASNWDQARTVTVRGVEDNDTADETVTVTHSSSGGGYGGVSETVTVSVVDDDVVPPGYVFSPQQLSVDEGDTATYTLRLATEPTGAVTVALSSGDTGAVAVPASFVFTNRNWYQPRTVTVRGVEDNDTADETVTVTHSSSGGGFGPLSGTVTVTVVDDTVPPGLVLSPRQVSVGEGDTATYTLRLETRPTGAVTVAVSSGDTGAVAVPASFVFTTGNWDRARTVTVRGVDDDDTSDETVAVAHTASGGGYGSVTGTVTVTVDDDDTVPPGLVFSPRQLSVGEGDTATYTLRLATRPTGAVTVAVSSGDTGALAVPASFVFTASNWDRARTVTVRGVDDDDTSDESVTVAHSASGGGYGSVTGTVTVSVDDDDTVPPGLVFSARQVDVGEGDTATYTLRLATRPTGAVTVAVSSGDTGAVAVPASFVFTASNWDRARTVTVRGVDDDDTSDETVAVAHSASGGGYGSVTGTVTVTVDDDDTVPPGLVFSPRQVSVGEGDTATYTLRLATRPTGAVTVAVSSGDTGAVAVPASFVFTASNWDRARTVTVRGVDDDDISDESVAVSHSASGGGYGSVSGSVTVNVADDDVVPPGLVFSARQVDVGEGATATYTMRLATRPTNAVTVAVSSGDTGAVAVPASFVFTASNWDRARTVTVRGVDDDDLSDETVAVSHSASGGGYGSVTGSVTVTVDDDDTVPPGLVFSARQVDVGEGATATYTLRLATRPTAAVTVAVSSGDTGAVAVPASFVFTTGNWDQVRTVTVRGVDDDDTSDESVAVSHTASGGGYGSVTGSVTVTVDDDDTVPPGLVFSARQVDVGEGDTATYTLRLATRPTGAVTVAVSSGDSGAVAVPASFVFTTGNWDQVRTVTVRGVDDGDTSDESVAVSHTASGGGYGGVSGTVTVSVADDDTVPPGLELSRSSVDVGEGDTASYTLRLAAEPDGPVTVAVSSGDAGAVSVPASLASLVFTTSNWDQRRTVTVRGVEDDDTSDETVAVTHTASGGGYGSVTGTVTVTVDDDDVVPPGLVFSARQVDVGEGDTATYTMRLATRPTGAVTVAVRSGDSGAVSVPASFVFTTGNWDQVRTVTVRGVEDGDTSDESVAVAHTASGGGYGGVSGTVTVTVDDDDTVPPALVLLPRRVSVGEGDTATYRLSLATRPTAAVTVTLSSGDTGAVSVPASFVFTASNWDQARTVTVRGVEDNDTADETVTVTHSSSGGGYGGVSETVTVSVVDDDVVPPGYVFSPQQLSVDEGDTATYTLRLATEPTGAVTVALSSGDTGAVAVPASFVFTNRNWYQPRTVTVRGVEDNDTADETVTVTHSSSGGGFGPLSGTVTVTVVDDTVPPGLVLSPRQVSVGEGDTATYTLRLETRPTGAVTVAVSSGDTGAVAVPASFVFTTGNWDRARTVTVRGVDDDDTSDETVAVAHTASGGGYGSVTGTVTVTVDDDDTVPPGLVFSPQQVSVGEGDTATYTLRLATRPTGAVTVAVSSGDTGAVAVPASFVFTASNWDRARTVTVRGVDDDDTSDESVTVAHSASGGGYGSVSGTVTVSVDDDDTVPPGLVFSARQVDVGEGDTATYTLRLATRPTGAVTVAVSSGDTGAVAVPASFVFTTGNWDRARTVTVRGVDDDDLSDETVAVAHSASGGGYGSVTGTVTVTVDDDDTVPPGLVFSARQVDVDEGDTATYTMRLATRPTGSVTVTLSSGDTGAVAVPASFVFTASNWDRARTVTVRGVDDDDLSDETVAVTHSASGGGYGSVTGTVTVTVDDDDTVPPGLVFSAQSVDVGEGDTATYTMRLATRPTGPVTVAVSSGDTGAVAVPASFVFTASNWDRARTVTVRGVDDDDLSDETVAVSHSASGGGYGSVTGSVTVTVDDDDTVPPGLVFSARQVDVGEGATATYTLRLATRPTAAVTVAVSSGDSGAVSVPASFVFTTGNWDQVRTVTVRGVDDGDTSDESVAVSHTASGGGYGGVSGTVTVSVADDDTVPPGLELSRSSVDVGEGDTASYTLRLAAEPDGPVTVAVSSGDTGAVSVPASLASLVFTTSNWDQRRTVTVRGVEDDDTSDETVAVTHTASGGGYGSVTGTVTVTVDDDDVVPPGLVFSARQVDVGEGDTATYTMRLATRPTGAVTVAVRSGDSGAVSVPVSFVFTTGNWDQVRTVTVRGVEDGDTSDESVAVAHTASGGGYGGVSGTVTVTVDDDDTVPPALVLLPRRVSVGEGDTATYRLSLATRPTAAVTVTLSSGDTGAVSVPASFVFTASNWDQARTVTVRGVEDNDTADETVTVTHSSSGGGYGGVSETVTVSVVDDDVVPPGYVFSPQQLSVDEGDTATYTLRLATEPTGAVTVALSSGDTGAVAVPASFVFTNRNWYQPRTVTVRGVEDNDTADETVTVTHSSSGGGFGPLSATVTVSVVDDDTVPPGLVFSPQQLDVAEGDTATYTMRLAARPTGAVTVAVSSGDTGAVAVPASFVFTASNWDRARPVTVRGVDDGDTSDETVAVTHSASGGGYGSVTGTVTVSVDDDDTVPPGLEFSPQQLDVDEGDTATYTMRLATRPTAAVTVALSSGDTGAVAVPASFVFTASNWDRARTVTVRGVDDDDTSDETVAVTHSASGGGYGSVTGTVTVSVDDDDTVPPGLVFSPRQVSVGEGDTATYTMRLATRPTGAVTVAVSSGDTGAVAVPASFVFTASNWDRARPVTVRGVDDDDTSDETVAVAHSASGGGYGSVTGTVTVSVDDDDTVPPGLVFSPQQLDVAEGDTATYTMRLAARPTGAVTVAVSSGDTGAVAVPASFVFTASNWDRARPVTVRGVDDDDTSDETVAVTHTASGGGYGSVTGTVTVTVDDDDTVPPGLEFSARQVDVAEGDTATYTMRLATRPTGSVTVAVSSGDTGAVAVPASFVFTASNWDRARPVTVRGVDDDDTSDESVTVSHSASGGGYGGVTGTVTVTVDDDDTVPPGLEFSAQQVSVGEGDTATYTMRLATQPTGSVTVAVSSGDTGAVAVPASFVFTASNWDRARPVTVRGVDDDDTSDESVTVSHSASGGGYGGVTGTVTVTVDDDDTVPPGLEFSPRQVSVGEGDTATYTMRLATRPTGAVTVAVSSGDSGAVSVPVSFVFTTGNWDQVRTVTVRGVEDGDTSDESVAVAHTASGGGYGGVSGTVTVTVDDDDTVPPALVLLPRRVSVGEGDTATYRLSLATRPTAAVTVTLSSGDTGAVSVPASFVFTASNWDRARTVTVRGVEDGDTSDESVEVAHTASGGGYGPVTGTVTVSVVDDDVVPPGYVFSAQQVSVDEGDTATYTLRLATEPTGAVTVALSSGDTGAVAVPASFVFTNRNWYQPRTVTVRGVEDNDTADESVTVTHSSSGGGFGPLSATVTVSVVDDDTVPPGLEFSPQQVDVGEGDTATYTMRLATRPTGSVTVAVSSGDTGAVAVPASFVFTTGNWDQARTVTVRGVDDDDTSDESVAVSHSASGGGYGSVTGTVTVTVDDDDTVPPGLVFSAQQVDVDEGDTATYTMRLATRPTGSVTVAVSSGDTGAVAVPASFVFTASNWDQARTVTVRGVDDDDTSDESVAVSHSASGGGYGSVTATVTVTVDDDDTVPPGLVFSAQQVDVAEGDTATYTMRLATQPTAPVTVAVSSGDTGAVAVPASFVFTTGNWDQARTVTVRGVDDDDTSDESVAVTHSASGGGYGSVTATVTVSVDDDDTVPPGLEFSAQQVDVAEGDTATYTMRLATRPTGSVTVAVSSGDTGAVSVPASFVFTTSNWDRARTVTVRGVDDDDASDESVAVTHTASRGGYGSVTGTVTVNVTDDDDDRALVFSESSVDVGEGDTATYTLRLATRPTGSVTVTLSSGDTDAVSVPASFAFTRGNWDQARTVTVRGVDDDDASDETVAVTHTASRGGYGSVTGTVTVNVTDDDDDRALVFSESSVDVGEGDTATYTLRLATRPTGSVTVTLSSGDTDAVSVPGSFAFTRGNWDQARTVTVRGVDDDDASDETVAVTHTASRGGYGSVTGTVTVNVDDDDTEAFLFSESSVDVGEGDTATYTLRLATQPRNTVTVTLSSGDTGAVTVPASFAFTTGNWDQARTVTVRGVDDGDTSDETVAVTHSASGGGYGSVTGTVTVSVDDDDTVPPGLVFSAQQVSVGEGDTATYTMRLATQPTGAVTVAVRSGDTGAVSVPVSFVFTTGNWDQARTVTVRGVDDGDTSDESVAVTHSASGGGYGSVTGTVTVTVDDDDTVPPGLVFSAQQVSVGEGDTATYTMRLATQPTGAVTVAVSSGDTGAVSVPASFVFTTGNWDQVRTVTVRGVEDGDTSDESVAVTHTASGGGYGPVTGTVTVSVVDDDVVPPGYVFSAQQVSVDEGDTATYTLRLATEPTGAVTVALSSGDTGAVAVPASFVFTNRNWNQPRTVTVRGVHDDDRDDESVTVTHSSSGGGFGPLSATVTVSVVDDDTVPPGLEFSPQQLDVDEGDTATYTMRLATRPTGAVTVTLSSGDTGAVAVPASFVFTASNWDRARPVTVRGVDDDDTSDETVAVTHTASGGGYGSVTGTVTVSVDDDDTVPPGLVFSPQQLSVGEGDTATYTMRLAARPTAAVTVAVSSGDTGAVAVPASFVFTASNWDRARPVTVRGVDDDDTSDETVAVTHSASGGGYGSVTGTVTVSVDDDDTVPPGLVFSPQQLDVAEGDTATYTMRLAARPTGAVTVAVSSGDTGAVAVPASFVFTASNWDRARPVTVRGVDDDDTSDETVAVTHSASGGGYGSVTGTVTVSVDDDDTVPPGLEFSPQQLDVAEGDTATYTMRLATRPTGSVTVTLSSGDTGAVAVPASFVFTASNWDRARPVTVRGVDDDDTSDETVAVTHSASGGGYGSVTGTVTVSVDDDDTVPPGLVLSPQQVDVDEGDTATYTLNLATRPTGSVTVTLSSGDTGAVAVPASFVFTASNWDRARPVTVRGVDDDDTSDETVAVTHTASGGGYGSVTGTVTVSVDDDDTVPPGLVFSAQSVDVGEGATATYTLRLATQPTGSVTVAVSSGDTGCGGGAGELRVHRVELGSGATGDGARRRRRRHLRRDRGGHPHGVGRRLRVGVGVGDGHGRR